MATLRSLKIMTSRCKRIVKELHVCEDEVRRKAREEAFLNNGGADNHVLGQPENEMINEITHCRKRLEAALEDLRGISTKFLEETDEKEGPEIDDARNTIAEAEIAGQFH